VFNAARALHTCVTGVSRPYHLSHFVVLLEALASAAHAFVF
jgi:hypothetical protein